MERTRTVAIAGAGIAGLTAAILLARGGFRVVVLERDAILATAGAGIQLTPNAAAVLFALGIDDELATIAALPDAILVRNGRSGRRIVSMPLGERFARGFGFPYRTVHRADLHHILAEAARREPGVELLLGHECLDFADHALGLTVLAETERGDVEIPVAALIGADGVGSLLRLQLGGPQRRRTGRAAWRTVVPAGALPPGIPPDVVGLWLGAGAHIVHYPVRGGAEFNVVAVVGDDGADGGRDPKRMRGAFRSWARSARSLVAVEAEWHQWPISTIDPSGPWSAGPVALIGDAAHAMAPFLAQGGAMAIEDAAVLARLMIGRPDDLPGAIRAFESSRKPRVRRAWRAADSTAELYHLGMLTGAVRNAGMRFLGGRALLNRYAWLYRWRDRS